MSDVQKMTKLPDTMVRVSYWALDCLLDWAEYANAWCDRIDWCLDDSIIDELREAQSAGDAAVFGAAPDPASGDVAYDESGCAIGAAGRQVS